MEDFEPVARMSRDIANAAKLLSPAEARFFVDTYLAMQRNRIRSDNRTRTLEKGGEPHEAMEWLSTQEGRLEAQMKRALQKYAEAQPLGEWAMGVHGIGPVIAAGLLSHIDMQKAPTAGHIWRFAGMDPTVKWGKGEKRPWNATLKVLCYYAGESFVKFHGREESYYGHVYAERKAYEERKNEAGDYADQAAASLAAKKYDKTTDAYKAYIEGKLPKARIHARAKRYAVKLFLAHYHEQGCRLVLGTEPPMPYPIAHLGHAHWVHAQ